MNAEEKAAAEKQALDFFEKQARQEEAKARQEEARLERAKITTGATLPPVAAPADITLEFAMASDTATVKLDYLLDPYLPSGCVVCFAGRGSTAKSSFIASMSAHISSWASTLWLSVEEPSDWIRVRHIKSGGAERTLVVVTGVASKRDNQGRVIGSNINLYEHLEPAVEKAKAEGLAQPLRLVVLDTAVGLTTWAKGESPNDDGAVKRLLAYLQSLAEKHDVTIAFIQHANKGKHDYFADTVAGSSAWTNSPRLSFVHARDRREDYGYVMRVAKSNLTQAFATTYRTDPIHTLHEREDGGNSVLCRVVPGPLIWGEEQSMEVFEDAVRKPQDDESGGGGYSSRPKPEEPVITAVVELVHASLDPVSRPMVEAKLGREVRRGTWRKVDDTLGLMPFVYRVVIEHGTQNRTFYRRQTETDVPPAP